MSNDILKVGVMKVKNWEKFQHFKDRRPPWVKLYRELLDDMEWHQLSGDDSKVLVMIWLIASEDFGMLPDLKTLAFRLRITVGQLETSLSKLGHWVVTERYQPDIKLSQINSVAEVSNHQETETETETEILSPAKLPTCPTQSLIDMYHKVLPELPSVRLLDDGRKKSLSSFWKWVLTSKRSDGSHRASTPEEGLVWIEEYFNRARDNDFLMGRNAQVGTHANWKCDLDFLLTEKGKRQVIEKTQAVAA